MLAVSLKVTGCPTVLTTLGSKKFGEASAEPSPSLMLASCACTVEKKGDARSVASVRKKG